MIERPPQPRPDVRAHRGMLPDGHPYLAQVPERWDGTLILYSHGPLVTEFDPVYPAHPVIDAFLDAGHAVAGSASTVFWPLLEGPPRQIAVLDEFAREFGAPRRVVAYGQSIGGYMTCAIVQRFGERIDGALSVCGPLAGGVATQNHELDIEFMTKTLLANDVPLELVRIADPVANLERARLVLETAMHTPEGRARVALVGAAAGIPAWPDPAAPEPAADDHEAYVTGVAGWFRQIVFLVIFSARAVVERRAGGNFSWNTDVDYGAMFEGSRFRELAKAHYRTAGLDLEADLDTLARAQRVTADEHAVRWLERAIVFDGDLRVPVVTLHTTGDGLCTPDHEGAYADVVAWRGKGDLLRQLYIRRGGHCTFTVAETLTGLGVLVARLDSGAWPNTDAATVAAAADELPRERHARVDAYGGAGLLPARPAFTAFQPPPFPRRYDARDVPRRAAGNA